MQQEVFYVAAEKLEKFMVEALVKAGVPAADAAVCANVLIAADQRGIDSHGIGRLKSFALDRIKSGVQQPVTKVDFVRRGLTTAVLDGNAGMAAIVAKNAMEFCIDSARQYGLGMAAVRNSTHFGIAAYWSLMAAERGMIGVCGTNARPSIAPTFSVENMLGTNPIAVAMPSDEAFPFSLDSATSIAQRGKIENYERLGKDVPPGWVIGETGESMTNAAEILVALTKSKAALAPLGGIGEELGGHKGYGMAAAIELFSSALQAGAFMRQLTGFAPDGTPIPPGIGHFFMAIDIEAFIGLDEFKKNVGDVLRELRSARLAPGEERIYTAGEKEYLTMCERARTGIPVSPGMAKTIAQVEEEYGVKLER